MADMLNDAHFKAREAIVTLLHKQFGDFPMQNVVPHLSATPGQIRWLGPELDEHHAEVFSELLGIGPDEQAALRARGAI